MERTTTMPLYEYQCDACGHRFEVIQKFSDAPVDACRACGQAVRKLLSSPAIQFKGSGWYITDYAKKSGDKAAPGSGAASGEGKAGGDGKAGDGKAPAGGSDGKAAASTGSDTAAASSTKASTPGNRTTS